MSDSIKPVKVQKPFPLYLFLIFNLFTYVAVQAENNLDSTLVKLETDLYYYPQIANKKLDSLIISLPPTVRKEYEGEINLLLAKRKYIEGEIDSSLILIENALTSIIQKGNSKWQAKCNLLLGKIVESQGYYAQALINYFEVIQLLNNNYTTDAGFAYMGITRCKKVLNKPFNTDLKNGIIRLDKSSRLEHRLYSRYIQLIYGSKQDNTICLLEKLADDYYSHNLKLGLISLYKSIASIYKQGGDYDSAHIYIDKAILLEEKQLETSMLFPSLYQFKGLVCFIQQDYIQAKHYLLEALSQYEKHSQKERKYYAYKYLYRIYKNEKDLDKAFDYLSKTFEAYKFIRTKERQRMGKVAEVSSNINLLDKEIILLKAERRNLIVILLLTIFVLTITTIAVATWIKYKNRCKREAMELKNNELKNILSNLGEKKMFTSMIETHQMEEIIPNAEVQNIRELFDKHYINMLVLFNKQFDKLNKNEVRYLVMIGTGLQKKEISKILNVQPDTIRKYKQRVLAKISLPPHYSLEEYIKEIITENNLN